MKIIVVKTIIEASAEDLRQSNSLADSVANIFRGLVNGAIPVYDDDDDDDNETV